MSGTGTAPHPEWTPPKTGQWATSRPTRSTTASGCCSSTRWPSRARWRELAAGRDTAIVLTSPWHQRDAHRSGGASRCTDLRAAYRTAIRTTGIRKGEGWFTAGDRLPVGIEAFPGREEPFDLMLWVESRKALVAGDTLVDRGQGIELVDAWLPEGVTRDQVARGDEASGRAPSRAGNSDARAAHRPTALERALAVEPRIPGSAQPRGIHCCTGLPISVVSSARFRRHGSRPSQGGRR